MNNGFITLHRKIMDWEWFDDHNTFRLFIVMLFKANHRAKKWRGITIDRGQFISGRKKLAKESGLTERQVRTAITKLKSTNELTTKTTSTYTIYTIENYSKYQNRNDKASSISSGNKSNERPTSDQRATTNNNENNENNENNKQINIPSGVSLDNWPALPSAQVFNDWMKVRKTKRATNTQTAFNAIAKQLQIATNKGFTVEECIATAVERSWAGFNCDWMGDGKQKQQDDGWMRAAL